MLHFKYGLGWKACYDDEKNLYTAKTSWRGDFDLYEIDSTDMVIDENYATLCAWAEIQRSGNVMSKELTDIAVELWENEKTKKNR